MKFKKLNSASFTYILIIFFFVIHFKFFENTYIVLKNDLEQRLISNYGYCEKNSYGFIKFIEKKYKLKKNIRIYNDENYPLSDSFIYKPKTEYMNDKIILINYNENKSSIDIRDYKIIEKFKNCFYLKKND